MHTVVSESRVTWSDKQMIHELIDDAMEKKDRYVTLYFGEHGISVSVYPLYDEEDES